MKKRIWMLVLLGLMLAGYAALADTDPYHFRVDESSAIPMSVRITLFRVQSPKSASLRSASLKVRSHVALIYDEQTQRPLYNKNGKAVMPIASITKLMTAMVLLDAHLPMDEEVSVEEDDLNSIKRARSRMPVGMTL
jgi:D-alanyl-D-alanine carboxypeptidase